LGVLAGREADLGLFQREAGETRLDRARIRPQHVQAGAVCHDFDGHRLARRLVVAGDVLGVVEGKIHDGGVVLIDMQDDLRGLLAP
jgi:hypothetical protein